jgi:four helix bundle protein
MGAPVHAVPITFCAEFARAGMRVAQCGRMVVRRFEELDAWRLADELKKAVYQILDQSAAGRDLNFYDQLRNSASSPPANISEGFGYYEHPQFARHVRIAIASLDETRNHLADGIDRRFWTADQATPLIRLANRARGACAGLLKHLRTTRAPSPWPEPARRDPSHRSRSWKRNRREQ